MCARARVSSYICCAKGEAASLAVAASWENWQWGYQDNVRARAMIIFCFLLHIGMTICQIFFFFFSLWYLILKFGDGLYKLWCKRASQRQNRNLNILCVHCEENERERERDKNVQMSRALRAPEKKYFKIYIARRPRVYTHGLRRRRKKKRRSEEIYTHIHIRSCTWESSSI